MQKIKRLPITKARVNLGAVVRSVYSEGGRYILEKDGYPVAAILSIEDLEDLLDARELEVLESSAKEFVSLDDIKKKHASKSI